MNEARKFIRHDVNVPIDVQALPTGPGQATEGRNVSFGGLSILLDHPLDAGQIISIRIPTVSPPFDAKARVIWCRPEGVKYCIGVAFLDSTDAFQSRMVEQVCAIETYRRQQMKKGRRLTTSEASAEWIAKYADHFPG